MRKTEKEVQEYENEGVMSDTKEKTENVKKQNRE
jgi:hypothetical protein